MKQAAYRIQQGIPPENILICTFTNKAAGELKTRISEFCGDEIANKLHIGTYHKTCIENLRKYAKYLGYTPAFTICDDKESKALLETICENTTVKPGFAFKYIQSCKHKGITYKEAIEKAVGVEEKLSEIYRNYQLTLQRQNSMDFEDIILNMVLLLENYEIPREEIRAKYQYVVADEAHDSSELDLKFLYLLLDKRQNLTMIFDPDQSIYQFRGSNIQAVMNFKEKFNDLKIYPLSRNFRSTETIVKATSKFIKNNPKMIDKKAVADTPGGDQIIYLEQATEEDEAENIVKIIQMFHDKRHLDYADIAILYRVGIQAQKIEKALINHLIPYTITGATDFYKRKEIKDILSYLQVLINPFSFQNFKRSIQAPKIGVGDSTIHKLYQYTFVNQCDIFTTIREIPLKGKAKTNLMAYRTFMLELREKLTTVTTDEILECIIQQTNFYEYIRHDKDIDKPEQAIEHIKDLINAAKCSYTFEFIQKIALIEENLEKSVIVKDDKEALDCVNLMTLHASKGLEFPCVFMIGMNEGSLPYFKAINEHNIYEERRLAFVGMTRARKYLILTRSKLTTINERSKIAEPSRFLSELPIQYVKKM